MGGISVNVLNLGAIADMIGSGIARNDAGGQANRWSELAQKLGGAGVLEINFGSDGISGKIGSGGIDLGGNLYTFAKCMNDRARLESYGQNHSQAQSDAAYWVYVYGDWIQENTAARIANVYKYSQTEKGKKYLNYSDFYKQNYFDKFYSRNLR